MQTASRVHRVFILTSKNFKYFLQNFNTNKNTLYIYLYSSTRFNRKIIYIYCKNRRLKQAILNITVFTIINNHIRPRGRKMEKQYLKKNTKIFFKLNIPICSYIVYCYVICSICLLRHAARA